MRQLAFKLLRAGASSWGGAAAGAVMATAAGAAPGPHALTGLLGIYAVCLAAETFAETPATDNRIKRIEVWLEELVRRHGSLDEALREIADSKVSHELVISANARALLDIRESSDERLEELLKQSIDAKRILDSILVYISQFHADVLAKLEKQASDLSRVSASVRAIAADMSDMRHDCSQVMQRIPSEDDLVARAVDDEENCRLRTEKLQELADQLEWDLAKGFAARSEAWLLRVRAGLPAIVQVRLLERLIEQAMVRAKAADSGGRTSVIAHLRRLMLLCEPLVPQLDDELDRLRVSSHLGYVESIVDSPAAGLARLQGRLDPYGLRRRLGVLLDADRHEEAWDLIRDESPAAEWVEKGIMAAGLCGQWAHAEWLLEWALAHAPPRTQHMCRLMFVEHAVQADSDDILSLRVHPAAEVTERLERSVAILQPLIAGVTAAAAPRHELDCATLRLSLVLYTQLGYAAEIHRIARHLLKHRPFDAILARLAVRGRIEAEADWPQRLRSEGVASFERRYLAITLQTRRPESAEEAFRAALRLAEEASTTEEREATLALLMELAHQLGDAARRQVDDIAPGLRQPDDRRWQLWAVVRMLEAGEAIEADRRLDELRDPNDPLWLQIHGQRCLQRGDEARGIAALAKAAVTLDRPDMLGDVAALALAHKQWQHAETLLERLLVLRPGDIEARASRAIALHQLGQHGPAAELLMDLVDERPDIHAYALNAATCLLRAGRPDKAAAVLEDMCNRPDPPLQAVIGLAQVLVERDRAKQAFSTLEQHRSRFWTEYEFVGSYWSIAFAAEEESAGHEGFVQMRALQAKGAAPADVIIEKSLDDILTMAKAHQERQETAAMAILQGKVPWLMVADICREPAYRAWAGRTGEHRWIFEHPVNVSNCAIYCSNGFAVVEAGTSRHLEPIESSGPGQPVVADLTALITLQKLGFLGPVADYCGRLHIPADYLFKMFWDNNNLRPYQPSRRTALHSLRTALADGRIHIDGGETGDDLRNVDEHYPHDHTPEGVYHMTDLLDALRSAGVATDAQLDRLAEVAHRPPTTSAGNDRLETGDRLRVGISTLSTIHTCGALDIVLRNFHIHVSDEDRQTILGESLWFESQENLIADHNALWSFLRDDPRVVRISGAAATEDPAHNLPSRALEIAEEQQMPLLADDRFLQGVALNSRPGYPSSSFGTAQLLGSMCADGHITRDQYASCVRRLMEWRYRFILLDPDLLMHWVRRSLASVPGPDLQVVAQYFRACLRDPGLFSGLEPTDPPSTVAFKLHQTVESAVGEFIGLLWSDEAVPEERAVSFTQWSLAHLLPSPPANMEPRIRLTSDLRYPFFWTSFLLRLAQSPILGTTDRLWRGVSVSGDALGMSTEDTIRSATEIIDGIDRRRS